MAIPVYASPIERVWYYVHRLFCGLVTGLHQGGVYLNVGSAVLLPEVFLKAISAVRNLGRPLTEFTTVNFDFLQHYRPRVNVVERPHAGSGGKGYAITGHHELMLPLLAAAPGFVDARREAASDAPVSAGEPASNPAAPGVTDVPGRLEADACWAATSPVSATPAGSLTRR